MKAATAPEERFSGHESFVCRYGWLRKAYDGVVANPSVFSDLDQAIVALGVGSNMVKSVEFWGKAFGIITSDKKSRRYEPTDFGRVLLDLRKGSDPYLEELGSLWLLHWKLVTNANLAAWNLVFQDLQEWRITRARLTEMLQRRGRRNGGALVESTVKQHLEMLIATYSTPRTTNVRALEETLGSPLQELGLLTRLHVEGANDDIIEVQIGPKPTLPGNVFLNAVIDYWARLHPLATSLSLQEVMFAKLSPGVVFRLDEASVIQHLTGFADLTEGVMGYQEGALVRRIQLSRNKRIADVQNRLKLL
jgi:hypothetical protein